jgi:hypothetical protein
MTATGRTATKAELAGVASSYLDALGRRDLSGASLADGARYTENGQVLSLGSGVWASEGGEIGYRLVFADPVQGEVGAFAVVPENGLPAVVAVRLAVRDGLITEVETIAARTGVRIFDPDALVQPHPELVATVDGAERSSREQLVAIADAYFDAIEQCGKGGAVTPPPVAPGCVRVENGHMTTGGVTIDEFVANREAVLAEGFEAVRRMRIVDQLVAGCFGHITGVRDRRYPIVDEERGLVLGIVVFDQPGARRRFEFAGVGSFELPPPARQPTSTLIAELFKVVGGEIRAIEVVLNWFPYGIGSGWS